MAPKDNVLSGLFFWGDLSAYLWRANFKKRKNQAKFYLDLSSPFKLN